MRWTWAFGFAAGWAAAVLVSCAGGCSEQRVVRIDARPSPAGVRVDGVERGASPVVVPFVFNSGKRSYRVELTRAGYQPAVVDVTPAVDPQVTVDLRPLVRRVTFGVRPFPGVISINGKRVTAEATGSYSTELEFTLEGAGNNKWTSYQVTAERPGFQAARATVTWTDADPNYTLTLEPMRKDLTIGSTPPGARVTLDDEEIGTTPLTWRGADNKGVAFYIDPQTNQWNQYTLRVVKAGYDPVDTRISWDEGRADYAIDLAARSKTVRIATTPSGGTVTIDGQELKRDANGVSTATLAFPPVNDKGELKTYGVTVAKKTADSEWEPKTFTLGWDEGKADYAIALKEIKTLPVTLVLADARRGDEGWSLVRRSVVTTAWKDVSEPTSRAQPTKLTNLPKGTVIDSLAVSPDGSKLIFSALQSRGENDLRSQLLVVRTDGGGGVENFSDGKSLDLYPAFTPDGKNVVFSSNRGGRRMSVWQMSAGGTPGITQLTNDDNNDLWPSVDSARHLFYQAFVDTRPDPRLFMTELGKTIRTDLTQAGGLQPRVSPDGKADANTLLFTNVNEKTGKRDIFSLRTDGGIPENLTNSPDVDDFDPAWNSDATKVAYVSDAGVDEEGRHNFDIWVLDLSKRGEPTQLTTNGSWDDHPVWDPAGNAIYFRSNRGGEWAVWKIGVK